MDHVSERDFRLFRDVMGGAYRMQDLMLGALLDLAGPGTSVILLSDHGFYSDHLRPRIQASMDDPHAVMDATWHRHHGALVMAGPRVRSGHAVFGATVIDIAPTALAILGLPVGADMDGRVLVECFAEPLPVDRVFSWEALDGPSGMHPPETRLSTFESHEAIRQLIDLGYVSELPADTRAALDIVRRETSFNLGMVYLTTRRPSEALPHFQKARELKPDEPRYAVNIARCLAALGRHPEALSLLRDLAQRFPDSPDIKLMLSDILNASGETPAAIGMLQDVIAQNPDRPDLLVSLGELLVHSGRGAEAEPILHRAVALDVHSARAHHALGLIALRRADYEGAVSRCLDALELIHFFPDAHYTLATALTWMKDYARAMKAFEVVLSMQPGMIDAHRYLATIHRHLGNAAAAGHHRQIAERLIADRTAGRTSLEDSVREPPLGPEEWSRFVGLGNNLPTRNPD
jgi:tetratricopeptide (TPR) repeat protein